MTYIQSSFVTQPNQHYTEYSYNVHIIQKNG